MTSYQEQEDLQTYYLYRCPMEGTAETSSSLARSFWGKPEVKRLAVAEAELEWHNKNPKGSLKEVSRLALEIHDLESVLFDMVWSETNTEIPDGI